MQYNDTANKSDVYFTRCLGIYHLQVQPNGNTLRTYISVIVLLSIFSVLSAVGNGLIIYVYIKQKTLQRTNTLLLVCLAFLDFISAMVLEPLYVVRLLSEIFGFTSCVYILIVRRLLEFLRPVSFMTLALVTIERYLALFKPIIHRRMATKRRLLYVVLLIWFVWFLIIFIRSFFPRITSAFYIFFTFVAFSLLMGNLVLYFKIGKLARLHSKPTRISASPGSVMSTAPGSLIVGDKNPRCIGPGAKNCGVTYSKTEMRVNYGVNGKRHSESEVKSTKIHVQPTVNKLNGTHVLSNVSKKEIGAREHPEKDEQTSKMFQDDPNITATNSEIELNNNDRKSNRKLHVEDTNLKTEICQHESNNALGDIITHQVKTDINSNPASTDLTQEGYDTSQATNIQQENAKHKVTEDNTSPKLNTSNDGRSSTSPETSHKIAHHEKTIAAKDFSSQFKNAKTSEPPTTIAKKGNHQTTDQTRLETRERNATWMVFYIVAILTLCYSPIAALLVYLSFEKEPRETALFIYVPIADTIALFNALVNPFIYCYKNRKMREAVKNVLQKMWSGS